MNRYIKILLVLLSMFLTTEGNSQNLFEIGNRWDYVEGWWDGYGNSEIDTVVYTVISDTTMNNGKVYYKINPQNVFFKDYLRVDTSGIYYYEAVCEAEYLWYKFSQPINDSLMIEYCFADSSSFPQVYKFVDTTSLILGTNQRYMRFENVFGIDAVNSIGLTPKFGFTDYSIPAWDRNYYSYLLGCKLSSVTYGILTSVESEKVNFLQFNLYQNYPNPFNPSTNISWQSPVGSWQTLKVYDILGNEVATLVNEYRNAGNYEIYFQSTVGSHQLANGVYFYQLRVGDPSSSSGQSLVETKKMIFLK